MYSDKDLPEETRKFFGMVTNIDDNVGKLISRLADWGLEKNTLLIFMTDNGGTGGVKTFNAGMRGAKATAWQGGTRVPAFFRWSGTLDPGDRTQLAAHIDVFPTLAELVKARIPEDVKLEGRSLVPVLRSPNAVWPDRQLFTHVGRWPKGRADEAKYTNCSIRTERYSMVSKGPEKRWELYDLTGDPGERTDVAAQHADVVRTLDSAYDRWWSEVVPCLENENAAPPEVAPYKLWYWNQFGGGPGKLPDNEPLRTSLEVARSSRRVRPRSGEASTTITSSLSCLKWNQLLMTKCARPGQIVGSAVSERSEGL